MKSEADQFDSPWKEALEKYLRPLLEFCFPQVADAIDWRTAPEFLDKELQEVVRDAALGEQRVDKLVKVRLLTGSEEWILVHVEVQHWPDPGLPQRLYQYHHRLNDRYGRSVLTLVILADEQADWRPGHYENEVLGCRVRFDFPTCKLLDLVERAQAAVERRAPPGVIILANRAAQQTRGDMPERSRWKWDLTQRMYDAEFSEQDFLELYRLIDWLLRLPAGLELEFKQKLAACERSKAMPYVTSIERMAKEEGRQEGRQEGALEGWQKGRQEGELEGQQKGQISSLQAAVMEVLRGRFGELPSKLQQGIEQTKDPGRLTRQLQLAIRCPDNKTASCCAGTCNTCLGY
jgi:flagellar biosynthesis/type III secretory pathway protein FliH